LSVQNAAVRVIDSELHVSCTDFWGVWVG